jgi:phage shock protein C
VREPLYRSRTDRVLFGVAGGVAEWLDVDPAVVRLVWALLVVFGGAGLLLYVIAAFVIPEEPYEPVMPHPGQPAGGASPLAAAPPAGAPGTGHAASSAAWAGSGNGGAQRSDARAARREQRRAYRAEHPSSIGPIFGVLLIVAGLWFLARDYLGFLDERLFVPGLLIVGGIAVLIAGMGRPRHAPGTPMGPPAPPPAPPRTPTEGPTQASSVDAPTREPIVDASTTDAAAPER